MVRLYEAGTDRLCGTLTDRHSSPFDQTFAMRQATGARWMLVAVLPAPE